MATDKGSARAFAYFALFTEIGLALFVITLAGALAGLWLDDRLGTRPLFIVLGFLAGAGLGAIADWRLLTRFLRRLDDDA
jgi:F0F1-type ATP synthase assembly protein I